MNRAKCFFLALLALSVLAAFGGALSFSQSQAAPAEEKKTSVIESSCGKGHEWAKRIDKKGLSNFYRVTRTLYRGAQPNAQGMKELKKMGIKTIVSLRALHSDRELIGDLGLDYERIEMIAIWPDDEAVARFLRIATDKDRAPVFVHCEFGSDRTGVMCAVYRIVVCGWTKEEAIDEMKNGGFGFREIWWNLIKYVRDLDVDKMKKEAGLDQ
jgi:protein tyrosine/serine phosphatase